MELKLIRWFLSEIERKNHFEAFWEAEDRRFFFLLRTPSSSFLHNYVILRDSKLFELLRNIATRYALEKTFNG